MIIKELQIDQLIRINNQPGVINLSVFTQELPDVALATDPKVQEKKKDNCQNDDGGTSLTFCILVEEKKKKDKGEGVWCIFVWWMEHYMCLE